MFSSDFSIVFDLDGTLVDSAPDLCSALNFVLKNAGLPTFKLEDMRKYVGQGARGLISQALEALDKEYPDEVIDLWFDDFIDYYQDHIADLSTPFPGLHQLLDRLVSQNVKMGVCTNKRESLSRLLLEKLNLIDYFPVIMGADSLPVRKPDPLHLVRTIENLSGTPDRAVLIGDSETDILTAKAAQIPIIAVSFGYSLDPIHELGADAVIHHFDELESALKQLQ